MPVYDITAEQSATAWQTFIPTRQFRSLLQRTLTNITTTEPAKRHSLWLRGTFGTGKSHASAVVKHLLCDPLEQIEPYLENISETSLREQLRALRKEKRYFAVTIKGVEGAYDVPRFKLSLQRETVKALREAGHTDVAVGSDYATALDYIGQHESIVQDVLQGDMQLRAVAPTVEKLRKRLQEEDSETYMQLERALHERHSIFLSTESISDWLGEVEQEIERRGIADGMFIFWDEFTSVMDTIKSDRINVLQNIAEKSRHTNLFLFLISHRVERGDTQIDGEKDKMSDRFDSIHYQMDNVSTYLIMRHTFYPKSKFDLSVMRYNMTAKMDGLLDHLCGSDEEEKENIRELFPLHPYTAYLCSRMSDWLGSANRSVLRFMNDEEYGFKGFIDSPNTYEDRVLLTADRLWDFFLPSFEADSRCGILVSTYNSYRERVEKQGEVYGRVFKVILLLNALGVGFDREGNAKLIVPNEENIKFLFADDRWAEPQMQQVLDWLDRNDIVNRNVMGEYKIAATSYDPKEMQAEKQKVEANYKNAVRFLEYNKERKDILPCMFDANSSANSMGQLYRPAEVQLCSAEDNEALLRSVMLKLVSHKPNHLHIAIVLSLTEEKRDEVRPMLQGLAATISGLIILQPDEVLGEKSRTQFIQQLTNFKVAKIHFNEKEADEAERQAKQHIAGWMTHLLSGTYNLYFGENRYSDGVVNTAPRFINHIISYQIFRNGFEQVKAYRDSSTSNTFFKVGSALSLAKQVMEAQSRSALTDFKGSARPAQKVFEYGDNNLIDDLCRMDDTVLRGDSWLAAVCRKVNDCMDKARTNYADRFSLSEVLADLIKPPFGMFQSPACYAALTYALRRHRNDLFIPSTSQVITEDKLEDMIALLFKQWQEGNSDPNNKLLLRFGSKEESRITELLTEVFALRKVPGMADTEIKSLSMAKWGIQEFCLEIVERPLWSVKYCSMCTTSLRAVVDELIGLLETDTPTVEKIKVVVPKIDKSKVDLHDLLTGKENYTEGFDQFIGSLDVEIKEEWHEELMKELKESLPGEIAFWKETDVENRVQKFYIKKINPTPTHGSSTPVRFASSVKPNSSLSSEPNKSTKKIKQRIEETSWTVSGWQQFLIKLLDAHPEIVDYLDENLE